MGVAYMPGRNLYGTTLRGATFAAGSLFKLWIAKRKYYAASRSPKRYKKFDQPAVPSGDCQDLRQMQMWIPPE